MYTLITLAIFGGPFIAWGIWEWKHGQNMDGCSKSLQRIIDHEDHHESFWKWLNGG